MKTRIAQQTGLQMADWYMEMRRRHPLVPANQIKEYLDNGDQYQSFAEFMCPGHEWSSGFQEDFDGYDREVAVHCLNCGCSGDI